MQICLNCIKLFACWRNWDFYCQAGPQTMAMTEPQSPVLFKNIFQVTFQKLMSHCHCFFFRCARSSIHTHWFLALDFHNNQFPDNQFLFSPLLTILHCYIYGWCIVGKCVGRRIVVTVLSLSAGWVPAADCWSCLGGTSRESLTTSHSHPHPHSPAPSPLADQIQAWYTPDLKRLEGTFCPWLPITGLLFRGKEKIVGL